MKQKNGVVTPTPDLILKAMGYKRVQKAGGNMMVIVPKMWLRLNAFITDGHYWVKVESLNDGSLVLMPANKKDIEAMLEVNQCPIA